MNYQGKIREKELEIKKLKTTQKLFEIILIGIIIAFIVLVIYFTAKFEWDINAIMLFLLSFLFLVGFAWLYIKSCTINIAKCTDQINAWRVAEEKESKEHIQSLRHTFYNECIKREIDPEDRQAIYLVMKACKISGNAEDGRRIYYEMRASNEQDVIKKQNELVDRYVNQQNKYATMRWLDKHDKYLSDDQKRIRELEERMTSLNASEEDFNSTAQNAIINEMRKPTKNVGTSAAIGGALFGTSGAVAGAVSAMQHNQNQLSYIDSVQKMEANTRRMVERSRSSLMDEMDPIYRRIETIQPLLIDDTDSKKAFNMLQVQVESYEAMTCGSLKIKLLYDHSKARVLKKNGLIDGVISMKVYDGDVLIGMQNICGEGFSIGTCQPIRDQIGFQNGYVFCRPLAKANPFSPKHEYTFKFSSPVAWIVEDNF